MPETSSIQQQNEGLKMNPTPTSIPTSSCCNINSSPDTPPSTQSDKTGSKNGSTIKEQSNVRNEVMTSDQKTTSSDTPCTTLSNRSASPVVDQDLKSRITLFDKVDALLKQSGLKDIPSAVKKMASLNSQKDHTESKSGDLLSSNQSGRELYSFKSPEKANDKDLPGYIDISQITIDNASEEPPVSEDTL
ncbi:MAG: hypothetical protein ACPGEF_08065 [Endozoicomonas sp.]